MSKRRAGVCAAATLAVFALVLALFGVRYEVNDDALISCIAAGVYGGDTIHLCYVNILVGLLLKPFYLAAQGVNWYVVFSVAGLLVCFWWLACRAVHRLGLAAGLCAWGVFMLLAGVDALQAFQYTKNAAIFTLTGALLLAGYLQGQARAPLAGGTALLLAGACLRWQAFVLVLAMALPLLWLRHRADRRALVRLAAAVLLCAAAWGLNEAAYRLDEGWNAWRQYNIARTEISDHRLQYIDAGQAAEYGLSDADYALLESWDYGDTALFPPAQLQALAEALPHRTPANAVRELLTHLPDWLFASLPGWLLCGALVGWALFARKRPAQVLALAATLAVFLAGSWLLFYGGRTPWRVEYLMLTPCAVLAAACALPSMQRWPARQAAALLACCLVAAYGQYQARFTAMAQYRQDNAADTPKEAALARLLEDDGCLYVVATALEDDLAGKDVWHTRPAGAFGNLAFLGGWAAQSPLYGEPLTSRGFDPATPLLDAVDGEGVYLVDSIGLADKTAALQEHLGLAVRAEQVDATPWFAVYRLSTAAD